MSNQKIPDASFERMLYSCHLIRQLKLTAIERAMNHYSWKALYLKLICCRWLQPTADDTPQTLWGL